MGAYLCQIQLYNLFIIFKINFSIYLILFILIRRLLCNSNLFMCNLSFYLHCSCIFLGCNVFSYTSKGKKLTDLKTFKSYLTTIKTTKKEINK